jgi:hypothetical protein
MSATQTPEVNSDQLIEKIELFYKFYTAQKTPFLPISIDLIVAHKFPDIAIYLKQGSQYKTFRERSEIPEVAIEVR